jgi:hypothetical protein
MKLILGTNDFATKNPHLIEEWHLDNDKKPNQLTHRSGYKALWKCKKCNFIWRATLDKRSKGRGCPVCNKKIPILGKNDVATLFPFLEKEWSPENDKKLSNFLPNSELDLHKLSTYVEFNYLQPSNS